MAEQSIVAGQPTLDHAKDPSGLATNHGTAQQKFKTGRLESLWSCINRQGKRHQLLFSPQKGSDVASANDETMLSTPSTSHINFDNIYEPAEDSYLLLDTLSSSSETAYLRERFPSHTPSPLVLEVGTGSGVVLAFVAAHSHAILGRPDIALLGTDINLLAARAADGTAQRAVSDAHPDGNDRPGFLDVVAMDLSGAVRHGEVDVLIFNPPYVPTETVPEPPKEEDQMSNAAASSHDKFVTDSKLLELSYAGGSDGMVVTNRLLASIPQVLSVRGVAYILLCAQNKPGEIRDRIMRWPGGWSAEIVGESGKKAGWEKLCILRLSRQSLHSG